MIMPFVRLLTIYALVIIAVVAFFKRDALMQFSTATFGWPATESTAPEEGVQVEAESEQPATPVAVETATAQEPEDTVTAPEPEDASPQTSEAALPVIQMPVADVEDTAVAEASPKTDPVATAQPVVKPVTQPIAEKPAPQYTEARLKAARQTYWNGDIAGAHALYAALVKSAPNDPDVNGEYGNILFAQRQYDAAANAFLKTGKILIKSGKTQQIQPIIAVLQNIAPQKAATLRALASN